MSPLFSVVIPTFNRARTIVRAVDSVLAQTLTDFEILVVDDGDDGTEALLRQFAGPHFHYVRGQAQGVAGARNLGIARSKGCFVAFLDADDWWYPHKLQRVSDLARVDASVDLFYSNMHIVDESGEQLLTPRLDDAGSRAYPAIVAGNFVFNSTAVVKKEVLISVGGFDTALCGCEDWDLWIRVTRQHRSMLIPEPLVAYTLLSQGSLSSGHETWVRAIDEVVAKSLAADAALAPTVRRQILAGASYTKATILVGASEDRRALREFLRSWSLSWRRWRALAYAIVLAFPVVRRLLPQRLKSMLRLPEAFR